MYKGKKFSALLLMAGKGNRFESSYPKQFYLLSGKKIYLYTLQAFLNLKIFDEIILVCHKNWIEEVKKDVQGFANVKAIIGGKTRQESAYLGLLSCQHKEFVMIHDAVRPFISPEIILKNADQVIEHKAVNTCIPALDTIVMSQKKDLNHHSV